MTSNITDRLNGFTQSAAIKSPVKAATTANITLSGAQTIDGVSVTSGDRVLVKSQTDTTENGIYIVSTGSWSRAADFDGSRDVLTGTLVLVTSGTTNAETFWKVSTSGDPTPGEAMTFSSIGLTGPAGATGPQGPAGADGTIDLSTLTNITVLDDAADEFLVRDDSDSGTNKTIVANKIYTSVALLTTETTIDAANDYIIIYDATDSDGNKMTPASFLASVNGLTEDTAPDGSSDYLLTYDASATAAKKVLPNNILKSINALTEDTSPDVASDYFVMYDASAATAKKVLPTNIFKGINGLTADGSPDAAADYVVTYDASAGTAKKVLLNLIGGAAAATTTSSGSVELATAAEVQTGTDTGRVPSVSVMGSHQSAAKFWVDITGMLNTMSAADSYNVTSVTDVGPGHSRVTIATDFSSANYCVVATLHNPNDTISDTEGGVVMVTSKAVGTCDVKTYNTTGAIDDPAAGASTDIGLQIVGFGDQ